MQAAYPKESVSMNINGIDEKDNLIVNLLIKDARMTYSDIGAQVGLTRVAVKNRVKALEAKGILRGYHAEIDPLVAPQMMTYIVFAETEPGIYEAFTEKMKVEPCVVTLCQTDGACALHAVCVVESIQQMRGFARRMRTENPGLLRFGAYSVLDVVKGSILPNG